MKLRLASLAILSALGLSSSLWAGESAVLTNGFTISHDHHEIRGTVTRLFLSPSSEQYVDLPSDSIRSFEPEATVPKAPPIPASLTVANTAKTPERDLNKIVSSAAKKNQLDADFVLAIIRAESNGSVHAVSRKGAKGLMQLMPATADGLGVTDSFDPNQNVTAGTKYIRDLLARYNNDPVKALAAYNAGAARVQRYGGVPPYRETRKYVAGIIRDFNRRKAEQSRLAKPSSTTRIAQLKPSNTSTDTH